MGPKVLPLLSTRTLVTGQALQAQLTAIIVDQNCGFSQVETAELELGLYAGHI